MKQVKVCQNCKRSFVSYSESQKNCSKLCYFQFRWQIDGKCKNCGKKSKYRYCSRICLEDFSYRQHYPKSKKRYWEKKVKLINELGGRCVGCGVSDIRVLQINHIDRTQKRIPKNRHYTWRRRFQDWEANKRNLELRCANCHSIYTWKQMGYGNKET